MGLDCSWWRIPWLCRICRSGFRIAYIISGWTSHELVQLIIYNIKMKRTVRLLLFLLLSAVLLMPVVSCVPVSNKQEWSYADLRLLDPLDNTPTPSSDILAVYTRNIGFDLEIRVDLLDLPLTPDYRLVIYLDTQPGGSPWDLMIDIPADNRPRVKPSRLHLVPRLVRNPWLDTVTVRFNSREIPQPFSLKVVSFSSGDSSPVDETSPVRSDAFPPGKRAPLSLVFWGSFLETTPAQALRRWDGAHTGPRGERHGLKHIVDNAGKYGIPVALLDLKTPDSLAALNYMGIIPHIQDLARRGLLILPDVAYGEPAAKSILFSRRAAAGFGLPTSQFAYNASNFRLDYLAQFLPLDDDTHLSGAGSTRIIPLPKPDDIQATQDGLSIDVRRSLVAVANSSDSSEIVMLGGDLPISTWGNEDMAGNTFAWIAAHPWIHPLTADDLMTFPVKTKINYRAATTPEKSPILTELFAAPDNALTNSAWQTYFMLTTPTNDEQLDALRPNYLGQVGELLAAARWVTTPSSISQCDLDLNGDGLSECILSNQNYFTILNPDGARMSILVYLDARGPHQVVGPTSQFAIGLSDPSEWHPGLGQAADPSVIPGAFSDEALPWITYTPVVTSGSISFKSVDGAQNKTYNLLVDGIEISYRDTGGVTTRVPLALDPQSFFFSQSTYFG